MVDQRNTGLDKVLFDVELRPLKVNAGKGTTGGTLFRKRPNMDRRVHSGDKEPQI